jgi:hypothetical protein
MVLADIASQGFPFKRTQMLRNSGLNVSLVLAGLRNTSKRLIDSVQLTSFLEVSKYGLCVRRSNNRPNLAVAAGTRFNLSHPSFEQEVVPHCEETCGQTRPVFCSSTSSQIICPMGRCFSFPRTTSCAPTLLPENFTRLGMKNLNPSPGDRASCADEDVVGDLSGNPFEYAGQ